MEFIQSLMTENVVSGLVVVGGVIIFILWKKWA